MNILRDGLQKAIRNTEDKAENDEGKHFINIYNQLKHVPNRSTDPTYQKIPEFYKEGKEEEGTLLSTFQVEARTLFLQRMDDSSLDTEELESLKRLLEEYSFPEKSGEKYISYLNLRKATSAVGAKCDALYTPKVFGQLIEDIGKGTVPIVPLFTYAMRKTWLRKTKIGLAVYDGIGRGFLRDHELDSFIADLIPECPQLRKLQRAFQPFYVCTVATKFKFFLDPLKKGRVRLKDVLASSFLDDLLVLRTEEPPQQDLEDTNWFSSASALRVYGQYLALDKDGNGMLSRTELAALGTGTLNKVFIQRLFQECQTYGGEMDYQAYLEFVLALNNKQEPQALRYFFKIFDMDGKGYLDAFCLNYFFRGIQEEMRKHKQDPVSFEDIKDELFDMISPTDPSKITLKDLLNCDQSDYFICILTDLNDFWNYENRDSN